MKWHNGNEVPDKYLTAGKANELAAVFEDWLKGQPAEVRDTVELHASNLMAHDPHVGKISAFSLLAVVYMQVHGEKR